MHSNDIFQFLVQWIHYSRCSESTRQENDKSPSVLCVKVNSNIEKTLRTWLFFIDFVSSNSRIHNRYCHTAARALAPLLQVWTRKIHIISVLKDQAQAASSFFKTKGKKLVKTPLSLRRFLASFAHCQNLTNFILKQNSVHF